MENLNIEDINLELMEMGANVGSGTCPDCETFLHIIFNPERKKWTWKDLRTIRRSNVRREENAKTDSSGSRI